MLEFFYRASIDIMVPRIREDDEKTVIQYLNYGASTIKVRYVEGG